jgi:hypothetical protein
MEFKSLHIAMREAIEQFGFDVLTESRLTNILLDYGAYSDVPASKAIIQAIIAGGYSQKILDLGKHKRSFFSSIFNSDETIGKPEGEEWRNKLESYAAMISKRNGFQQPLVDYVIECLVYGLDWIDNTPILPQSQTASQTQAKPLGPQPKQVNSSTSSGTNTNKTNSVTYQNISQTQFFVMKVKPANATVYVDDHQQYVSNGMMAVELPVGTHSYEVRADDYETQTGTVKITSNFKYNLDVELKLRQKTVKLSIEAGDSDAEIFINGVSYGRGKWEGLVEEGTYEIEGRKHRYYPQTKTVTLQGIDKQDVFIPCLIAKTGNLKVNVQPYGSKIIINGSNEGTTPLLVQNVVIGERKLTIKTSEGTEYSTTVEVRENQVTDVNHIIPSLFLDDYSKVRLNDYFYEDGTFSHELAEGKTLVGMVFSLETSKEECEHGWTHGQIVATRNAYNFSKTISSWGIVNDEILRYSIKNGNGFTRGRDTGYLISHLDCVLNNPEYVPFMIAAKYDAPLPHGKTSGWYLPCLAQWKAMYDNTHHRWSEIWHFLQLTGRSGVGEFATSTPYNRSKAWKYRMGMAAEHIDMAYQLEDITSGWGTVRAVAAF